MEMSTAICEYQTESSAAVRPRTSLTRQVAESPARPSDVTLRRARLLAAADIHFIECNTDATYSTYPHPAGLDQGRLLEADEETALFRVMNSFKRQADALRESLDLARPSGPLMDEFERLLERADEVRNGLARVFIKLAASIAKRFASAEFPFDELASEANMTLLLAIDKFDPEYGARFSTYATHAIRRNLCRYLTRRRKARRAEAGITNLDAILETRKWTSAYQCQKRRTYRTQPPPDCDPPFRPTHRIRAADFCDKWPDRRVRAQNDPVHSNAPNRR